MRLRFRHIFITLGSLAVVGALYATDPDHGVSTSMLLLSIVTPVIAVLFAHMARKALFDYPEADAQNLFGKAKESPVGAGLALVAMAIVLAALLGLFGRSAQAQTLSEIPPNAAQYLPLAVTETTRHWPDVPTVAYAPSLIELESCITPTHKRCWSPTSELRTPREQGLGLGQLTRAWRADGSLRFDSLSDARRRFPQLRELSWSTLRDRPDLQIRTLVLMSRDTWEVLRVVSNPWDRLAMTDAAYNGGLGGLQSERRACQIASDCDPQKWFGNVERYCLKSKAALYAGRSPCDINRHHVKDVFRKIPKYQRALRT